MTACQEIINKSAATATESWNTRSNKRKVIKSIDNMTPLTEQLQLDVCALYSRLLAKHNEGGILYLAAAIGRQTREAVCRAYLALHGLSNPMPRSLHLMIGSAAVWVRFACTVG